jgi:hypothetical protein
MAKPILFLLKPGFQDGAEGPYFCPGCAAVEGFLKYAPEVERRLDIRRIDFPRPRKQIVELIGADHQGCPVLVLETEGELPASAGKSEETGRSFISGSNEICEFLGRTYQVIRPHL